MISAALGGTGSQLNSSTWAGYMLYPFHGTVYPNPNDPNQTGKESVGLKAGITRPRELK